MSSQSAARASATAFTRVHALPDHPGEWEIVHDGPADFKVQIVDALPDFTVEYVDAFPGCH